MTADHENLRSFDEESATTLLPSEQDDLSDLEMEKAHAYEAWTHQLPSTSRPLLNSAGAVTGCLVCIGSALHFILPSFVQSMFQRPRSSSKPSLHPTAYLDGMRGVAAFVVFLCHLSYGTWDLTHSYGTPPDDEYDGDNTSFLQLPIVRLLYSGPPMVAIFFVISGYVLSYKPVRLIRTHDLEHLMSATSSAVFRRALRLYLPCFASTFLAGCLAQMGVYQATAEFGASLPRIQEYHLAAANTWRDQFSAWLRSMFLFVNIFDWGLYAGTTFFDPHLWTIPVEYRCSLLLFMTHVMTARMSTRARLITLAFLLWWGARWNKWDMVPFWGGQFLAELHYIRATSPALETVSVEQGILGEKAVSFSLHHRVRRSTILPVSAFLVGCYLASFPDADGHISPGFVLLNDMIPDYWTEKHRFWPNIGAILIVWSVGNTPMLKSLFEWTPIQYLGTISFPLYCVHGPVIQTLGYWTMMNAYDWLQAEALWQYHVGFTISAVLTIAVVVWTADVFWRGVDAPSVQFAKWLEGKLLA